MTGHDRNAIPLHGRRPLDVDRITGAAALISPAWQAVVTFALSREIDDYEWIHGDGLPDYIELDRKQVTITCMPRSLPAAVEFVRSFLREVEEEGAASRKAHVATEQELAAVVEGLEL